MYLCTATNRTTGLLCASGRHPNIDVAETFCRTILWRAVTGNEWKPFSDILSKMDEDFDFTVRLTKPAKQEKVS